MIKIIKLKLILLIILNLANSASAENSFFEEGQNKYDEKKIQRVKIFISKKYNF